MREKIFCCMAATLCFLCFSAVACKNQPENPANDTEPEVSKEYIDGKEVITADAVNAFDGEGLRLLGRTYLTSGRLALENAGTGAEVYFYGTQLQANIISGQVTMYCRVFVDGDTEGTRLTIDRNGAYKLAEDLQEGVHTVKIVKSTSSQNGKILIKSFLTDGKFLRPEESTALRLEFVGDSITVGAGVFADNSQECAITNSDATKSYAYLTAQALGADCSLVATEGICVKAKSALSVNMCEMYQSVSSINASKYPAEADYDIVVVGLGTNDGWYMSSHAEYTVEQFSDDYRELLGLIRERNENATIVCVYGMMGVNEKIKSGIQRTIETLADERISSYELPADYSGASSHPSAAGAKKQSVALIAYLQELIC